ncbi:1-acyl-sn-glycerol-3-phosphate acyltransferase alpha-like [Lineus longissimus]|uniref:1-acyl-sn-glycerol-3-phosphate acyltransferase alpha-like n=1 Tax=Lineus longissimus TaxID=88925 RepID=UPI002B4D5C50
MMWLLLLGILLLTVFFLYRSNQWVNYQIKFLLYYTLVNVIALISMPIFLFRPFDVENYRIVGWMLLKTVHFIMQIKIDIRNKENTLSDKPAIMVCNHQSSIDLLGMMSIWPSRCTGMAKKSLLYAGPFGPSAWLAGTIFIDRFQPGKARETMRGTVDLIKKKNVKVWVFPEGTRNHDGNMLPFKKGAFHLAIQAQIPIIPVVISTYDTFMNKKRKFFKSGKCILTCLPPVSTEGLTADDVNSLTERVRDQMVAVFKASSDEIREIARVDDAKKTQ